MIICVMLGWQIQRVTKDWGISIRPRSTPKGLNVIHPFLRPMSIIRGVKELTILTDSSVSLVEVIRKTMETPMTWNWCKIIGVQKSFQHRGNRAYEVKDYVKTIYYYDRGGLD
jgi:hypothetical protein